MLRKFYVHNFKTLLNLTFEPKGLNLLIGRNNVGKTNLCQAMEFLSRTASEELSRAAVGATGMAHGLQNKHSNDSASAFGCECELTLQGGTYLFTYRLAVHFPGLARVPGGPRLIEEALRVSGQGFSDVALIRNEGGQAKFLNESAYLAGDTERSLVDAGGAPTHVTMVERLLSESPATHLAYHFKSFLESWSFLDLDNGRLRDTRSAGPDAPLQRDGGNLASVVQFLKMRDDRAYREVVDLVRLVEPRLEAINFLPSPDPSLVFMVFEDSEGKQFHPPALSNGTLRLLALAHTIAESAGAVQRRSSLPRLIVIEEPETGIFVRTLKDVFRALDPSGRFGQYVFTSHQPYFIDLFDGSLDGVFFLKREPSHTVLIKPDPDQVRKLLGQFSLGELHFREMLGS
jgi:predicted ATPase